MIQPESIIEVKDATRIEDVVGQFVTLKQKGVNLTACCPFHAEKTPSFAVNPARGIFKCFGCGKGGDAIAFLREQGMDYVQAIRWIAKHYNIELKESENGKPSPAHEARVKLRTTASVVQAHFALSEADETPGRRYWLERGFKPETIDEFGIGWSDGTKPAHIDDDQLRHLGIINEKGNVIFYKRSTIPIHDRQGNVIAWAGRTVDGGKDVAKYINSPETPIYSKAKTLFNLHRAAPHIRKAQEVWVVEGYADVMALWQVGVKNAVAISGTALTTEQAAELKKFNGEKPLRFILCMDNETTKGTDTYKEAVAKAYQSALEKLVQIGEVRKVVYPKACKDMADVVHRGIEPQGVEKVDALKAMVEDAAKELETASPVEMAEFQDTVARMLSSIAKDNVRSIYINDLSGMLKISPRDFDKMIRVFRTESETEEKNRAASEYRYIKVGDEYYQRLIDYDIFTKSSSVIYRRRKRQELTTEGVSISAIPRFHDWIILPEHINYQRTFERFEADCGETFRFFNSYNPLPHKPREFELPKGFIHDPENFDYEAIPEIRHTAAFMKHIFDHRNYGNKYLKIGWDWLTLCYLNPVQRLPGLALVSSDEGTGKSTFINMVLAIFGQNATKTEASRIGGNFNALSAGKVIQCVEETKDERGDIENKLKDLITAYEKVVEAKHQDAKVVKSFDKYIFASNHEEGFMKVGTATTRFFVMKVHPITNKVTDFEDKLYLEIPYLLYFMQKRGVLSPKEDRLYFNPKSIENEALLKLRHASKDQVQQVMEELFSSMFLRCELTDPIIYMGSQYLKLLMCEYGGKSYEQKTPVYFQNTATKDMRLIYRESPTKKETIELEGIHADAWINRETWEYKKTRTQQRFIEIPIWKFCTIHDVTSNYTAQNLQNLILRMDEELPRLIDQYGAAPSDWLYELKNSLTTNPAKVGEDIPF